MFSATFHFVTFLKVKKFTNVGEGILGSSWIFWAQTRAIGLCQPLKSKKTLRGFLPLYKTHKRIACSLDLSACYQTASETYGDFFVPSCVEEDHDGEEEKVRHIHTRSLLAYSS